MGFGSPTYLWALLALLIPLAIHLWSKKEGKTIKVGTIQFFSESDSKKSRSIKLNELLLLILRTSLIMLVVMILSEPYLNNKSKNQPISYLIEPSLLEDERVIAMLDTISDESSIRLFEPGLPYYSGNPEEHTISQTSNYWQLVSELNELQSDSIVVFMNGHLKGIKGKRPLINKRSEWLLIESSDSIDQIINARNIGENIEIIELKSNASKLSFNKVLIPKNSEKITVSQDTDSLTILSNNNEWKVPIKKEEDIKIGLIHTNEFANQLPYFDATIKTLSKFLNREIILNTSVAENFNESTFDLIICLGVDWENSSTTKKLIFQEDSFANDLIIPGSSKEEFHLTSRLNSENIVDGYFSSQLLSILDINEELTDRTNNLDKRTVSLEALKPIAGDVKSTKVETNISYISNWLWMSLFVIFIIERILSFIRKQ